METLTHSGLDHFSAPKIDQTTTPFFDPEKDRIKVLKEVQRLGLEKTREVWIPILTGDIKSQVWELTQSSKPYEFNYEIKNNGTRLVHQSDYFAGKDILEVTTKAIRNGLEFDQMVIVRQRILSAENGASVVWISPKKVEGEENCPYPDTQVNIAQKIGDVVEVRQFQSRYLDLKGSARFLKEIYRNYCDLDTGVKDRFANQIDESNLAEIMITVIKSSTRIETREIQDLIYELTRQKVAEVEVDPQKISKAAESYFDLLLSRVSKEELTNMRGEILKQTLPREVVQEIIANGGVVDTSCGTIEFSRAGSAIPSWCEITPTGEIKCKYCNDKLSLQETQTHRCVC